MNKNDKCIFCNGTNNIGYCDNRTTNELVAVCKSCVEKIGKANRKEIDKGE